MSRAASFAIVGTAFALFVLSSAVQAQSDVKQLYEEAQQAQASGDLATATRKYQAIIQLQPHLAEAYANLGNLYYQQHQNNRAKTAYRRALEEKPGMAGPHFFLGVIAFGEHAYDEALEHLNRAMDQQPSNALILAYIGYTHFARAEYHDAVINLEKADASNGDDPDILYHLSKSYTRLADRMFAQLQVRFRDSVYPILVRAQLSEAKEDWTEAARQYDLALAKMPGNTSLAEKARWIRAKAAGGTERSSRPAADDLVDGSVPYKDSPPSGPKLRHEIERWRLKLTNKPFGEGNDRDLYSQGEAFQALAYLTSLSVFELDHDSYRAHELRAQMLEGSNDDEGAIKEYREALKRKPDLQNIHFAIGTLFWKDHRVDEAQPELESELKANPHHPQALYELGDISAFKGQTSEAEKYFLAASRLEPNMTEAHLALERIYTESGRYDQSLAQLRAALQSNPNEPTVHYRLAVVYRKLGRKQDAERELTVFERTKSQAPSQSGSAMAK